MTEEARKKIEEITTAIGAACEVVGFLREQLMNNGFTRDEAVGMCCEVLTGMIIPNANREEN